MSTASSESTERNKDLLSKYPEKNIECYSIIFKTGERKKDLEASKSGEFSLEDLFNKDDFVKIALKVNTKEFERVPIETKKVTKSRAKKDVKENVEEPKTRKRATRKTSNEEKEDR